MDYATNESVIKPMETDMIDCEILENGDLKLIADEEAREYIAERQDAGACYWSIMAELFEDHACNGSYTHFDAGQADPFVGLTAAPCIAEGMAYPDSGDLETVGRVWWLSDYAIRDDLGELRDTGETIYHFGFNSAD
jgi:hypothetical protein